MKIRVFFIAVTLLALALGALALWRLEAALSSVPRAAVTVGQTPVTLYGTGADSLVVVAHGFAGSRQMMEAISVTLARGGHRVAAFDFLGHGRHPDALSPDIDSLTGTTEDLVLQTIAVIEAMQAQTGIAQVRLVGHSMATDVVVRAAARLGIADVVAISMYSEAVTATHPQRLLVISGAQEGRLRQIALEAVAQVAPASEGETVRDGDVARRAVAAPRVGHAGVLWSPVTSLETAAWFGAPAPPVLTGRWLGVLLACVVVLFWPLSRVLPVARAGPVPSLRRAGVASALGAVVAPVAALTGLSALGLVGFGALALFLGLHGAVALAVLRPRVRVRPRDLAAAALLGIWGLGAFALALDRYGAAFLPAGPRLPLMALLVPACMVFALGDRALVAGRGFVARVALRLPLLASLLGAMLVPPMQLGMLFTVLPVLALFVMVYGTMAFWAARRSGPTGPALASGVILAWAIAASTPLFHLP